MFERMHERFTRYINRRRAFARNPNAFVNRAICANANAIKMHIVETSIDVDNYVSLILCDQYDNIHSITINVANCRDDIDIVNVDDATSTYEFNLSFMTRDEYDALIR